MLIGFLLWITTCCLPSGNNDFQPNILIIVVDTLRFDATGLNGNQNNNMPFLMDLASRGIHFKNNYSTYDCTVPSHFSIFTGYIHSETNLDNPNYCIAHQLGRIGYDTFGISANASLTPKGMGILGGFNFYICVPEIFNAMSPEERMRWRDKTDPRIEHYGGRLNLFNRRNSYESAERVMPLLKERLKNSEQPFFGFVNFMEPHDPYYPDPSHYDKDVSERNIRPKGFDSDVRFRWLSPELRDPDSIQDKSRRELIKQKLRYVNDRKWSLSIDLTPKALKIYRMRYEAEARDMNRHLGDLFEFMKNEGLLETTAIIITSDHGEAFGEDDFLTHMMSNKGDLEATRRVPLVFYFPPRYHFPPKEIAVSTTVADIAPSIYDLVGLDWLPLAKSSIGNYGKSLLPYISESHVSQYSQEVSFDPSRMIDEEKRKELEKNARERLRSLGYIK
jgi:arylsulfatase A-like enzyme